MLTNHPKVLRGARDEALVLGARALLPNRVRASRDPEDGRTSGSLAYQHGKQAREREIIWAYIHTYMYAVQVEVVTYAYGAAAAAVGKGMLTLMLILL